MRMFALIATIFASICITSAASAQTYRPTLESVLPSTLGQGGTVTIEIRRTGQKHTITIDVPKQKDYVVVDGEATVKTDAVSVKAHIFPTNAISPIGNGRSAMWVRAETSLKLEGVQFQEFVVYGNGAVHILKSGTDMENDFVMATYEMKKS